ncbi:hypothetical protein Lal_00042945 [Lupinus albus]|nr:hypothetical protein Lal_00042945 [Lupinus albus]
MIFLAQARQLSLRRESSSILQDFTLPGEPLSPRRESLAQARILQYSPIFHPLRFIRSFLGKFFHASRTTTIRKDISGIRQQHGLRDCVLVVLIIISLSNCSCSIFMRV